MIVKRRFDGDFLQSFSNSISFIKNSNGVLSSISSETSSCDLSTKNNIFLNKTANSDFYSFNQLENLFSLEKTFLNLNFFNTFKNNTLLCIGEIGEKVAHVLFKSPVFLWVYLSNKLARICRCRLHLRPPGIKAVSWAKSHR